MIKVDVQMDIESMKRRYAQIERDLISKAAGSALNKTAISGRKVADQKIRERFALSSATVKGNLKITRASTGLLIAYIDVAGNPIPLKEYSARQTRKGVTYRVSKHVGRKLYLRKGQNAFIVTSLGGHVFVRSGPNPPGPKEAPIAKVYGPSLPQMFVTNIVQDATLAAIKEVWPKRFAEELNYQLRVKPGRN